MAEREEKQEQQEEQAPQQEQQQEQNLPCGSGLPSAKTARVAKKAGGESKRAKLRAMEKEIQDLEERQWKKRFSIWREGR